MNNSRFEKLALWAEDRPGSVSDLIGYCEDELGLPVEVRTTPYELNRLLNEYKDKLVLIVVDLLLYGVNDLNDFGMPDISTGGGYRAGWEIVDKVLRPENGPAPYAHTPVAIITTRQRDPADERTLENIKKRAERLGHGAVLFMEKAGADSGDRQKWRERFENFAKAALEKFNERVAP